MKRIVMLGLILFAFSVSAAWAQVPTPAIHGIGGTKNFVPVFTGPVTVGNSQIFQSEGGVGENGWKNLIGIGTTDPQATLHVNAGAGLNAFILGEWPKEFLIRDTGGIDMHTFGTPLVINCCDGENILMLIQPDNSAPPGKVSIGEADPQNILTVKQGASTAPIADAWTTYSSKRWKTNIQPLDGALNKVQRLQGVYFDWKGTGKHDLGLVAEEVAQVVPEVVAFEPNGTDAKSVDYGRLTALLVEAVKEQQGEIKELKSRVQELSRQVIANAHQSGFAGDAAQLAAKLQTNP